MKYPGLTLNVITRVLMRKAEETAWTERGPSEVRVMWPWARMSATSRSQKQQGRDPPQSFWRKVTPPDTLMWAQQFRFQPLASRAQREPVSGVSRYHTGNNLLESCQKPIQSPACSEPPFFRRHDSRLAQFSGAACKQFVKSSVRTALDT